MASTTTAAAASTTAKAKNSPKTTKSNSRAQTPIDTPPTKDTPRVEHQLKDDSKSLAIMIEDSQLLSRSDLEESLLKNLFSSVKNLESDSIRVLHASTDKHLPWTEDTSTQVSSMRFVPQTRVFYINKQYRTVFLVDVTSSVLTVDSGGTRIVMGQVMETLTKCLKGLSERFSCPGFQQESVQSEIHITVIAECSQFASNLHTGEMLANFPTIKVLLQDIVLTETNLHSVLKVLKVQLAKFQARLSRFRGELRRTREVLGYSLAVEDAVDDENTELDLEDDISNRKSWGVGLSGANLSYTLTAGLFALGMMPESASPSLVVVTDGVVKSNLLHGSTILRRLMELDVSCSIIQLGGREGIAPSCNWGFIQDTEILRFVAEATLGKFIYSQDCTVSTDISDRIQNPQLKNRVAPNMYHRAFLIRELCLLKPRPGLDDFDDREDSIGYSIANFPWDPKSVPEPIKMMQTVCKDYLLNIPVEKLVTARIRQGFRTKGVSIVNDKYLISMTLAWLPNVNVQYKIKGQYSSKNSPGNFFGRLESPKIEIDIVAYEAFAIHFLNTQHVPANANHSVYAKVFRLHRYIVGLSDSDVTLRGLNNSHATASQALLTQRSKAEERSRRPGQHGHLSVNQERQDYTEYITRLSEQWSAYAKDMDYQYSRCWYSESEFEALLVVPPPSFLPTALDSDHSLVKYCENLETTLDQIRDHLKKTWASFEVGKVLVKTFQGPEEGTSTPGGAKFCELHLFTEPNVSILKIQLRFFGILQSQRHQISKGLQTSLFSLQTTIHGQDSKPKTEAESHKARVLQCRRPIHRLLMRHLIHEAPLSHTPEATLIGFHTHVSEPIGEESVLRSYMLHKHWGWKDQVRDSAYLSENNLMASQDLAFQFLCAQRISEGFLAASVYPNRVVFCKEMELSAAKESLLKGSCTVQYLIFRSPVSGELVTELWMEPFLDTNRHSIFDRTKSEIIAIDRLVLSRLASFEAIHTIGRLKLRPAVQIQPERGFMYPWLFDPPALLRQQRFITLAYEAPRKCLGHREEQDLDVEYLKKCIHTLGLGQSIVPEAATNSLLVATGVSRDLLLTRNSNASSVSLSQSLLEAEVAPPTEHDIVVEYKDQIRELCCADRDLAILHLFMEKSLSQLADGEIMAGSEDDACSQFFLDIKTSIKGNPQIRQALLAFHCAGSFQDIRCFVKIPNPRVFLLVIIPKLGSVISHIAKLRSLPPRENDTRAELARNDFMSCLVFECMRSKPLTDMAEYSMCTLDQNQALFDFRPATLNQRGPGISQQPLLIQPLMFEAQNDQVKSRSKLWESTANLSETINVAFSQSFAKAIYASLIQGHPVDKADLERARQICTRTSVDINITGFLNTLEQGRRNNMLRDEAAELKARFLEVLRHSFELAPVPGTELYFYRPLLRRSGPKLPKPKTRKRSPSVSRSGSIDADMEDIIGEVIESAERPLFLHLECSFQKPLAQPAELEQLNMKSSVTFPVTGLPVSYLYKQKGFRDQNYAPTNIGLESRPVDSADGTVAILHLVLSTLPVAEDYAGPTLKTIDSEPKINIDNTLLTGQRNLQYLLPTLDTMQLEAIADTEARLEWLLKEEIMHGILNMTPVTPEILNLVETQLRTKNNFVNFPTAMTLPLTFVRKRRGYEIFMQELGRTSMYPYELHQVGEYFYLTEGEDAGVMDNVQNSSTNGHSLDLSHNDTPSEAATPTSQHGGSNSSLPSSGDARHGLGIIIANNHNVSKTPSGSQSSSQTSLPSRKRQFWLILVPRESYVQLYFFSKALKEDECVSILTHTRRSISELCIKVNQLTLLQSLNETRNCSKYLVPSEDGDPNVDSGSSSDSDQGSQEEDEALVTGGSKPADGPPGSKKFKPGEFACPLVYRVAWPLHWRVRPGQATKSVAHLVLYPFAVQNRKNFYVVESSDDHDASKKIVVFLRLSEVEVQPENESTPSIGDSRGSHLSVNNKDDTSGLASVMSHSLEDSGSHANSPRPSPTASPGSRNPAPPVIRTETRELVIEVYGVERPGRQVTVDLFSLLENKFYNSVVLSVVSTFLSRNSTLKLTQADVDFILPVDRLEPARQVLNIPQFINVPYAFLMYLKQNLSLYLSPLTGPDKVNALTRHYHAQYGRASTLADRIHDRANRSHHLQIGDFSFFYNAVQGRSMTAIETQVGIGLAGVCLTVLGSDMRPVFDVGYQEGEHNMKDIKSYFESFPHPNTEGNSKYSLLVEVWAQGSVNATALLDAISQSFRQSLCDDIVETSISEGLCPSARDRRDDVDSRDGEPLIGERVQRNFIDPSFLVLQNSFTWKNPAVQSLSLEYSMPPWIMDSFLLELDEILIDVSVHFSPLLMRSMADSNRYKEHKASSGTKKSFDDMTNIRFILIGGIQDLNDGSNSSYYGRRTSMGSDRSHSRRSSLAESGSLQHSHKTSTHSSQQHPKRQLEDIKMYPNAVTTSGQDETMLTRNCFVVITANGFGLQAYTYNWGKAYHEFMFSAIEKVVKWHKDRMRLLDNVLMQKMGLFHHVPSILTPPIPPPAAPAPPTSGSHSTPSIATGIMPGSIRSGPQSSPHLGSNLRTGHTDPNASTTNLSKTATSPKAQSTSVIVPDAVTLASLVEDQFPSRTRTMGIGTSIYSTDDSRSEMNKASASVMSLVSRPSPPVTGNATSSQSQGQSQQQASDATSPVISSGLDVDQILRDNCLQPLETPRDDDQVQDEVQRHGKPFLDTFMYHTKNAEDQQNAYNVYQKWSRRYRDRKGAPNDLHENMNISDLAIMLRSSRLLHFCRTPLLFTEFSSSLYPLAGPSAPGQGTTDTKGGNAAASIGPLDSAPLDDENPVAKWYSALAETFMREYSRYLATVGMQLLMYGNSKYDKPVEPSTQSGEQLSFMSRFTVSQNLSVPSPAAFLFKSLQGGSIMCEVRLQGMFVCVTLYTLNRRYGKVKVAAPGFATAEANKQSLRVFTEQCARFKDKIHVNSFVYDFHLRYIHRILMDSAKVGQGSTGLTLPFSFDLMDVMHQFLQYHSRPAAYSRNRVYRGVYRSNIAPGENELPGHLFEYVIKNPQRYGFQAIHHQNRPRACFVSGRDLLAGYAGGRGRHDHQKSTDTILSGGTQGMKGFGVSNSRGGLALNTDRPFDAHARHTSHDSSLHTKRKSRRMTTSRSTYNVKETAILEDEGVEYVLVISDGDQDSMGLTVHYYLLILREEDVVKKLEDAHGPLVGARDRLLAANHNLLHMRDSGGVGPLTQEPEEIPSLLPSPMLASQGTLNIDSSVPSELKRKSLLLAGSLSEQEPVRNPDVSDDMFCGGERLMDATELQERITERAVLGDVVRAAEVRLDLMLKQAAQFSDRDSLWEMLLQGKIGSTGVLLTGFTSSLMTGSTAPCDKQDSTLSSQQQGTSESHGSQHHHSQRHENMSRSDLGFADFLALGQRFHSTPLEEMEPEFGAVIRAPGIEWGEVLTFLRRYYSQWAREFMEHDETGSPGPGVLSLRSPDASLSSSHGHHASMGRSLRAKSERARRHLVIFNPHNRDLLVHFVINVNMDGPSGHGSVKQGNTTPLGLTRTSTRESNTSSRPASRAMSNTYSQSHSQLHALLLSPSRQQSFSPSMGLSQYQQQQPLLPQHQIRQSFSETSSRVSSMSSIARAASMVVSKVTGRMPSKRRESVHSETSSLAPSAMQEDDDRGSIATTSRETNEPGSNATPSSSKPGTPRTGGSINRFRGPGPRALGNKKASSRFDDYDENTESPGLSGQDSEVSSRRGGAQRDDEGGYDEYPEGEEEEEDEDMDEGEMEDEFDECEEEGCLGSKGKANVMVYAVSREPKSGYNALESQHVGDIIRTLSYWLWKSSK
ncbi:KICSTOR complex protein szt2 [Mortierella antarctica]|nr:KICSTOR complex protein szt2 [Mortierella antarctica]